MVRGPASIVFASYFVLFRSAYLLHRHSFTFRTRQGLPIAPQYGSTVRTLLIYKFGTPNLALYALAPNHVFGR